MSSVIYKVNDNNTILEFHRVVVHRFKVSDVEDPDIYASESLWKWQNSDQGKFIIEHAVDKPEWQRYNNTLTYGYDYVVIAKLEKKKLSEFYLRWGYVK